MLIVARTDIDGNGQEDIVAEVDRSCLRISRTAERDLVVGDEAGALVALLRRDGQWFGTDVMHMRAGSRGGHTSYGFEGMIRAGTAVYLRGRLDEDGQLWNCGEIPARAADHVSVDSLYRIDGCGVPRIVFSLQRPLAEDCSWIGESNGDVTIRCARPPRSQRLRWDQAQFTLGEDAPRMQPARDDTPICPEQSRVP